MPSLLRVPLVKAQILLREHVNHARILRSQIIHAPAPRERLRLYDTWKEHNAELLGSIFTALRYRSAYMSKVKFDDDFIALDDRRNVELVLEKI
jgi:hypothetical protein